MVVAVEAFEDMDPSPRVNVTVTDLDVDVVSVRIFAVTEQGAEPVRDAEPMLASGSAAVTDVAVPLGVPVAYLVQGFDVAGVLVESDTSDPVTVGGLASGEVIFQDPLVPAFAVKVSGRDTFAASLERARQSARYRAGGRTITLMGEQGLLEGVDLSVAADSTALADALEVVLQAGVVLVRTVAPVELPRCFYAAVTSSRRVPVDVYYGGSLTWVNLSGDQVSRDRLATLLPLVTWQRFIDFYATWDDLIAAHPTWLSLLTDPPPAA